MAFTPPLRRSDLVAALLLQSQQRPRRAPTSAIEGLVNAGNSLSGAFLARKLLKRETKEALEDDLATIDAFNALAGTPGEIAAKTNLLDAAQGQVDLGPQASNDFSLGTQQPPNSAIASALGGNAQPVPQPELNSAIVRQLNPQRGNAILQDQLNAASTLGGQARLKTAVGANPNARARAAVEAARKRSPAVGAKFANALLPDLINTPDTFTTLSGEEAEARGFAPGSVVSINNRTGVPKVVQGPQAKASTIWVATGPDGTKKRFTDLEKAGDFADKNPNFTLSRVQDNQKSSFKPPSGFSVSSDGFSLTPIPGGPGDIQNQNLQNARSRGVAAATANLFGGFYDPETQEVRFVADKQRERMLAGQVRAMGFLQDGSAGSIPEAVKMAFQGAGPSGANDLSKLTDDQKDIIDFAKNALSKGGNPDEIKKRLREQGLDPSLLDQ